MKIKFDIIICLLLLTTPNNSKVFGTKSSKNTIFWCVACIEKPHQQQQFFGFFVFNYSLAISLNALAAVNPGELLALMSITSPVCGFLPFRAARARSWKVPNPGKLTFLPATTFYQNDCTDNNKIQRVQIEDAFSNEYSFTNTPKSIIHT